MAVLMLSFLQQSNAQGLLIDEGIQLADLQIFPVYGDTISYYYLPSIGTLGSNENGLPEFSYLRYVTTKESAPSDKGITEADGGAILHFLATYTTPEDQIKKAENELKQKISEHAILKGPVIFKDAKYTIISSILMKEGESKKQVITSGEAPIFQNSKLAFSFELTPKDSKLLLESFKMSTPDISIVFEFTFEGLSQDFYGEVKVNWDEFAMSNHFDVGGAFKAIGADISLGFDELRKNNHIEVVTIGNNDHLESLMNTAYEKLLKLVFEPVKISNQEQVQNTNINLLGEKGVESIFGFNASYKMKRFNFKGTSNLKFKGRENIERKHFITFNIGDLYSKYGKNDKIFKEVSLYDLTFLQRDVYVGVDGSLQNEFNRLVNNVTVTLKKEHNDGSETLEELSVNKRTLAADSRFILSYLNNKDTDLDKWRKYKYQTYWQFVGGAEFKSDWIESGAGMINLFVPYKRKKIDLFGSLENSDCKDVRAVSVQVEYPFFNETKSEMLNILSQDNNPSFEITLPQNIVDINYTITAYKNNGQTKEASNKAETSVIFIDDVCR